MNNTPTINTKFFKDWIAALRSGEYAQGVSRLKTIKERKETRREEPKCYFCCLGVAADLLITNPSKYTDQELPIKWYAETLVDASDPGSKSFYSDFLSPLTSRVIFGEENPRGHFNASDTYDIDGGDCEDGLAYLDVINDQGWTFTEIADLLEVWLAAEQGF